MDLLATLRTFIRVVELGSFSEVSRELNVSQSAVTRQINQLEERFAARLFHRTTRKLSLTDEGALLIDHARRLLDDATAMDELMGNQHDSPSGQVRVGLPGAAALFFVSRVPELLQKYPGLSLELIVDDRVQDLIEARIDVALRGGAIADSSLISRGIGSFRWIFVASPGYIQRAGLPRTPDELINHECILQGPAATRSGWDFGEGRFVRSVPVKGTLTVNASVLARRAARAGHGIARLTGLDALDDIREGRLVPVLTDFSTAPVPLHLVYPSRRHLAPRTRVVMEFLAEQMAKAISFLEKAP